jgi:hypothetical protein
MRVVTEADLNDAVESLTTVNPIATSAHVKAWLSEHGIDWDGDNRGGRYLEAVDRQRMTGRQPVRLQKWKAPGGDNAIVGWAVTGSVHAERWAREAGWDRVDLIDDKWTRVDEHGIPFL